MRRRSFLLALAPAYTGSSLLAAAGAAQWPAGDALAPLFLHGRVIAVRWEDPLPYLEIAQEHRARSALGHAVRVARARRAPEWALEMLREASVPPVADSPRWRVELPAADRLAAAGVARPVPGAVVSVAGRWRPPVTGTSTAGAALLLAAGRLYVFPGVS